jgi:hypothetical protein
LNSKRIVERGIQIAGTNWARGIELKTPMLCFKNCVKQSDYQKMTSAHAFAALVAFLRGWMKKTNLFLPRPFCAQSSGPNASDTFYFLQR